MHVFMVGHLYNLLLGIAYACVERLPVLYLCVSCQATPCNGIKKKDSSDQHA